MKTTNPTATVHVTRVTPDGSTYGHETSGCDESGCAGSERYIGVVEDAEADHVYELAGATIVAEISDEPSVSAAAATLGRKGGQSRTTAKAGASRANGAKGGRPAATHHEVRYTTHGGRSYRVDRDGYVLAWDDVAGHYTVCHSLTPSLASRIRNRARGPEGRTSDR